MSICAKGEELDDYAAKRYSDWWNLRNDSRPYVRAHYKRLKDEAYSELMAHMAECEECTEARQAWEMTA